MTTLKVFPTSYTKLTLRNTPSYATLLARWRELSKKQRTVGLTRQEAQEQTQLNERMGAVEMVYDDDAAARSDTEAIAALGVVYTEYEAQREALRNEQTQREF